MDKSGSDLGAVDRLQAAREEREAAEQQLAARKAWLSWAETEANLR